MFNENQIVKVKGAALNLKHYRSLGYNIQNNEVIEVMAKHLTKGSKVKILAQCDRCGKQQEVIYSNYNKYIERSGEYCCNICNKKNKEQTMLRKYGVLHTLQSPEMMEKKNITMMQRYGCIAPLSNNNIKQKAINTCIERYGVPYVTQLPEIIAKRNQTLSQNELCRSSKPQNQLYNLLCKYFSCTMNKPCSQFFLDIEVISQGVKIDVEYDGWYWHKDKQRDVVRDMIVKKYGYKVLRIKSAYKIPIDIEIIDAIQELLNTDITYKEIILNDYKNTH